MIVELVTSLPGTCLLYFQRGLQGSPDSPGGQRLGLAQTRSPAKTSDVGLQKQGINGQVP